jgi:ribosomal protein S18 acetylase RimI-like enzyme
VTCRSYVESLWGWSDKAKMAELKEDTARYLIVRDAAKDNAFAAFCHVRFDWEDDELVLYLYEIQLMPEYRRKGLGKFLMQLCELMARKAKLDALMLTVLGSDTEARAFYDHLKFEELDGPDVSAVVVVVCAR